MDAGSMTGATQKQVIDSTRWPYRPYCTNDFSFGIKPRPFDEALAYRYIQANPPAHHCRVVFDIDSPVASHVWSLMDVAAPNLCVVNRDNGHGHYLYEIESPVCITDRARVKPVNYLAAIEAAYRDTLRADPGYSGLIIKNPTHEHWGVIQFRQSPYELGELAEYVDLKRYSGRRAHTLPDVGLGRNVRLFRGLSLWAYIHVDEYRHMGTTMRKAWENAVLGRAQAMNVFTQPLPYNEIKSTARSVARWVWDKYWGKAESDRRWRERQAARGRMKGERIRRVGIHMLNQEYTVQEIADTLGVSRRTVFRWKHRKE
jgi:hypothetical protein